MRTDRQKGHISCVFLPVVAVVDIVDKCLEFGRVFALLTEIDYVDSHVVLLHLLGEAHQGSLVCFDRTADKYDNALALISVLSMF